jgi:hypothetical protein
MGESKTGFEREPSWAKKRCKQPVSGVAARPVSRLTWGAQMGGRAFRSRYMYPGNRWDEPAEVGGSPGSFKGGEPGAKEGGSWALDAGSCFAAPGMASEYGGADCPASLPRLAGLCSGPALSNRLPSTDDPPPRSTSLAAPPSRHQAMADRTGRARMEPSRQSRSTLSLSEQWRCALRDSDHQRAR